MSGVYIPGMKIPTGCLHCSLFSGQGCKATNKLFPDWLNVATRPSGCPLIAVPDHGRLIDADDVDTITVICNERGFLKAIDAPIIIPADKEKEVQE